VNLVTNKIYVANSASSNVTLIDGATNATTTITDPNADFPADVGINPLTNKIYLPNSNTNNITVIDGNTNTVTTVADVNAVRPTAVAVNAVTNQIYVPNGYSNNITVIDGATNATTTLAGPSVFTPYAVMANPVSNRIYVANIQSNNLTVIDGATNTTAAVTDFNAAAPLAMAFNPATNKIYVSNNSSSNVTVVTEQQVQRIPAGVKIHKLPGGRTHNPTPSFTFTAVDPITKVDNVLFQIDTCQGPWTAATNQGSGQWQGTVPAQLQLGGHVIYAYETDGQEATSTHTGAQSSPAVSNITAYVFLEY
jgi:YVTN family beta-propeller protein